MVATPSQAEASLRRAAILLSHLDAENRRRLLAHLPLAEANRLRTAAAELVDVDPLEVRRVVTAFMGRVKIVPPSLPRERGSRIPESSPSVQVTGSVQEGASTGLPQRDSTAADSPRYRLQFLSAVSDETLVRIVQSEHPQTVAVVLGALPPDQAARLLSRLSSDVRLQALRRLSRLEDVPSELLDEIGEHLRKTIGEVEPTASSEGHRTLQSIFTFLPPSERAMLAQSIGSADPLLSRVLASTDERAVDENPRSRARRNSPAGFGPEPSTGDDPNIGRDPRAGRVEPHADEAPPATFPHTNHRQRGKGMLRSGMRSDGVQGDGVQGDGVEEERARGNVEEGDPWRGDRHSAAEKESGDSTDPAASDFASEADDLLHDLEAHELRTILSQLRTREAILVLCGMRSPHVRRVLRTLPRRQAKEIEERMAGIGELELWEIDQAKQRACEVASASKIVPFAPPTAVRSLPNPLRFFRRSAA